MAKRLASKNSPWAVGYNVAKFVVGVEATNVINVAVTLAGAGGRVGVMAYLSDDSGGNGVIATAPSGAVAIGTNGKLYDLSVAAKKVFLLTTTTAGLVDINITEAGAKTLYLVIINPDGTLSVSPAITFAA
jgi:hypothetical protein